MFLGGGLNPSEKYESIGMMTFPTECKNNPVMFQSPPTSCLILGITWSSLPIPVDHRWLFQDAHRVDR